MSESKNIIHQPSQKSGEQGAGGEERRVNRGQGRPGCSNFRLLRKDEVACELSELQQSPGLFYRKSNIAVSLRPSSPLIPALVCWHPLSIYLRIISKGFFPFCSLLIFPPLSNTLANLNFFDLGRYESQTTPDLRTAFH